MAQRRVGWEGPELWLVLPTGEVRIGSKLRDLPENEERALAAVRRATGDERTRRPSSPKDVPRVDHLTELLPQSAGGAQCVIGS